MQSDRNLRASCFSQASPLVERPFRNGSVGLVENGAESRELVRPRFVTDVRQSSSPLHQFPQLNGGNLPTSQGCCEDHMVNRCEKV